MCALPAASLRLMSRGSRLGIRGTRIILRRSLIRQFFVGESFFAVLFEEISSGPQDLSGSEQLRPIDDNSDPTDGCVSDGPRRGTGKSQSWRPNCHDYDRRGGAQLTDVLERPRMRTDRCELQCRCTDVFLKDHVNRRKVGRGEDLDVAFDPRCESSLSGPVLPCGGNTPERHEPRDQQLHQRHPVHAGIVGGGAFGCAENGQGAHASHRQLERGG